MASKNRVKKKQAKKEQKEQTKHRQFLKRKLDAGGFGQESAERLREILDRDEDDVTMEDLQEFLTEDPNQLIQSVETGDMQSVDGNGSDGNESDAGDDEEDSEDSEDSGERALYSFPGSAACDTKAKTVGWIAGRSKRYINMFGKKSVARYRINSSAFPLQYEDDLKNEENVSLTGNRHGDEKTPGGRFVYTKRHILGIWGVAWKGYELEPSWDDLDLINPAKERKSQRTIVYVLIEWDMGNGETKKTWETRSAMRARWGTKDADTGIFKAALEAEERFAEAEARQSIGTSRSPSVGLRSQWTRQQREKSLGRDGSRHVRFTKSPRPRSPDLFSEDDFSEDEGDDPSALLKGLSSKEIKKMMRLIELMGNSK